MLFAAAWFVFMKIPVVLSVILPKVPSSILAPKLCDIFLHKGRKKVQKYRYKPKKRKESQYIDLNIIYLKVTVLCVLFLFCLPVSSHGMKAQVCRFCSREKNWSLFHFVSDRKKKKTNNRKKRNSYCFLVRADVWHHLQSKPF